MNAIGPPCCSITDYIWQQRYRYDGNEGGDVAIEDTWWRVANALAGVEDDQQQQWAGRFYDALRDFQFIPGGRIIAGAGSDSPVTLFNCFVMGQLDNDSEKLIHALGESVKTLHYGGGIGYDFSTLLPRTSAPSSASGKSARRDAPGPVAVMHIWNEACKALQSYRSRRGAMMGTLRCDHPDIEEFIDAKSDPGELRYFNCSVLVTDAFMVAVENNEPWSLVFPQRLLTPEDCSGSDELSVRCEWPGEVGAVACRVYKTISARELWRRIMRATYHYSEPGVLFIDRINRLNNLHYCEKIITTNPCGEIPLPAYGACDLGSINLPQFVDDPFTEKACINLRKVRGVVSTAVRMLDNVIELSQFPLPQQRQAEKQSRRIGLGITGLADALIMMNLHYGSADARSKAATIMRSIRNTAYRASIMLAQEKGSFPLFKRDAYLQAENLTNLPQVLRDAIGAHGIRNSHLTAIAPTGTISLLAGNVSSGVEPVYQLHYRRRILDQRGNADEVELVDYAYRLWLERCAQEDKALTIEQLIQDDNERPDVFVTTQQLAPSQQVDMVAALQPFVDSAISKTIAVSESMSYKAFENVYRRAYQLGLKGCTTFKPNPVTGCVLSP